MNRAELLTFLLLVFSGLLAVGESRAQALDPAVPDTITAVVVSGNSTVDADLVKRGFGLSQGDRYSTDAVRRGIRRLYDLGFFTDILVEGDTQDDGGIILYLRVQENPRVGGVEYQGLDHFKEKKLLEVTGPLVGRMADDRLLAQTQRRIKQAYTGDGYTRARVTARYLPGASDSRRILFIDVDEGSKMRIEEIRFVGAKQVDEGKLRGAMKQGTTGFLKSGTYKPELAEEDRRRIEARMANLGFRDGKVLGREVVDGSEPDRLVLEVTIEEGPRYTVGAVTWEGNEVLPARALYSVTEIESGSVFSQEKIEKTIEDARTLYANRGYIYLSIRPDYAARDSIVDVTFRVLEGEPSRVHDIIIAGNTRTKERVIRRQLAIRPGDLFRQNALFRSQRELQQLGFFSGIGVDSRPVPDSNDIDLILNVEERQVGTASAGFGFSSSVGLTGFMELGHPNLFGNAQSVNIRMERGRQRNNAEISFTEPWLFGTPTTVGVDLFSTNRILRDVTSDFEIRRAGGAVRLGRPLPLAYSRIFASYRLETQQIVVETDIDDTANPTSFASGFRFDRDDVLTSSFALRLSRNSTNHSLYPTLGASTSLRAEFTGGPLGGDQIFQKYELDHKAYFKTIELGDFKPILMLRPRLGAMGSAFRDGSFEPTYEIIEDLPDEAVVDTSLLGGGIPVAPGHRIVYPQETNEFFRLGGTSFDPLRGYDDFEIVPRGNQSRFFRIEDLNSGADSLDARWAQSSTPIFFPGGRYMFAFSTEWQFPVADPLHGLLFMDLGGTWNEVSDFRWDTLHRSVGFGVRMEVPLLGIIGFDYGYGFDRLDEATGSYTDSRWEPHIQFGRIF